MQAEVKVKKVIEVSVTYTPIDKAIVKALNKPNPINKHLILRSLKLISLMRAMYPGDKLVCNVNDELQVIIDCASECGKLFTLTTLSADPTKVARVIRIIGTLKAKKSQLHINGVMAFSTPTGVPTLIHNASVVDILEVLDVPSQRVLVSLGLADVGSDMGAQFDDISDKASRDLVNSLMFVMVDYLEKAGVHVTTYTNNDLFTYT